jgi:hypothetical protein
LLVRGASVSGHTDTAACDVIASHGEAYNDLIDQHNKSVSSVSALLADLYVAPAAVPLSKRAVDASGLLEATATLQQLVFDALWSEAVQHLRPLVDRRRCCAGNTHSSVHHSCSTMAV